MKYLLCFSFALLASCSSAPSNNGAGLKLYVFDCGENDVKDISLFSPGVDKGKAKTLVARCYYIKHPAGDLMWDTGLNDGIAAKPNGVSVRDGAFVLKVKNPLSKQLKEINLDPAKVKYVAFSHFHGDHTGNANLFKNSKVLIQKEEFDAGFGSHPEDFSFSKETYAQLKPENITKLSGDHDVFGDGSVVIKRAVGHTPGHQVLFIDLPKTGPIVLSGDLYHFTKNRTYRRVPIFNFNKEQTLKSMDKIEGFLAEKHASLWIQHDPEQAKEIMLSPKYYE